jgi:hypothetical protein
MSMNIAQDSQLSLKNITHAFFLSLAKITVEEGIQP